MDLRLDSNQFKQIAKGNDFVKYKGVIAKPGVLVYENTDGSKRKELLAPEELFATDSIDSFKGVPITDEHPANGLSSANYKDFAKGAVSNVYRENDVLVGEFTVYDSALNSKIATGEKVELSIGRRMALEKQAGVYNNTPYDAIQRSIKANHLAVTSKSRTNRDQGNRDVRILERFDSIAFLIKDDNEINKMENEMEKDPTLPLEVEYRADSDGKDYKVPKAVSDDIAVQKAKFKEINDTVKAKDKTLKELQDELNLLKENKTVTDEITALTKKIAELNASRELAAKEANAWKEKLAAVEAAKPAEIEQAAKERVELVETAKAVLASDSAGIDQLTNEQIKDKVIAKILPYDEGLRMDSVTSEIRNAHFKAATRLAGKQAAEHPTKTVGSYPLTGHLRNDSAEDYRLTMHNYKEGK